MPHLHTSIFPSSSGSSGRKTSTACDDPRICSNHLSILSCVCRSFLVIRCLVDAAIGCLLRVFQCTKDIENHRILEIPEIARNWTRRSLGYKTFTELCEITTTLDAHVPRRQDCTNFTTFLNSNTSLTHCCLKYIA